MGPTNDFPTGLNVISQSPLDQKTYFRTLSELSFLGLNNNKAFTYYDRMVVFCAENEKNYIWKERENVIDVGVVLNDFIYPPGSEIDNFEYSGLAYNFFEHKNESSKGDKGDAGASGEDGLKGDKGDAFVYSDFTPSQLTALKGMKGDKGDTGAKGDKGNDGTSVNIKGSYATEANLRSAHPTGASGDSYIIDGFLYVWNGADWENIGNIKGPKGDIGNQGPQGIQGNIGISGSKGDIGDQGIQGPQGIQGEKGNIGSKGDTGAAGTNGLDGAIGAKGDKGNPFVYGDFTPLQLTNLKGAKGDQGAQGIQGIPGVKGDPGLIGQDGLDADSTLEAKSTSNSNLTLVPGHIGGINFVNSPTDVTLTVQLFATSAFPVDKTAVFMQKGAGKITVAYASGVTGPEAQTYKIGDCLVMWHNVSNEYTVPNPPRPNVI
jgi:hypothetical protein